MRKRERSKGVSEEKKIKFDVWTIIAGVCAIVALVLIGVCILSNEWDDVALPIALCLCIVSNAIHFWRRKKSRVKQLK